MFMISKGKQLNISGDKLDGLEGLAITILTMYNNGGKKSRKIPVTILFIPLNLTMGNLGIKCHYVIYGLYLL